MLAGLGPLTALGYRNSPSPGPEPDGMRAGTSQREGFRLEKAIVVMRHGVRAPYYSGEMAKWSGKPWPVWAEPDRQMTSHGRAGIVAMGKYMAGYFARAGLLPRGGMPENDAIFVSFSHVPRARESAFAFMDGMLPGQAFTLRQEVNDRIFHAFESGTSRCDTDRIARQLHAAVKPSFDAAAARHARDFATLETVVGATPPFRAPGSPGPAVSPRRLTGPWRYGQGMGRFDITPLDVANEMVETFRMQYANNFPLDQVAFGHIANVSTLNALSPLQTLHYGLSVDRPYLSACRGSQLMDEIARGLDDGRSGNARHHAAFLQVYAGHDTNIAALRTMLRFAWHTPGALYNEITPGTILLFERWIASGKEHAGQPCIRLSYLAPTLDQLRHAMPLTDHHPPARADFAMDGSFRVEGIGYLTPQAAFIDRMRRSLEAEAMGAVDYGA